MAQYIVDFQAFKDRKNCYILKELAVISVESGEIAHCIIKPPYSSDLLSDKCRRQVDYVVSHHHGISWEDGYMKYVDAIRLIRDMTRSATKILIKGSERAKLIRKLTGKPTVDFDTLKCPKAKNLQDSPFCVECFYSGHTARFYEACSLRRVYKLKQWYLNYLKEISTADSIETDQDEYDTVKRRHDVPPCRVQERICCGPTTSQSKFTRCSDY